MGWWREGYDETRVMIAPGKPLLSVFIVFHFLPKKRSLTFYSIFILFFFFHILAQFVTSDLLMIFLICWVFLYNFSATDFRCWCGWEWRWTLPISASSQIWLSTTTIHMHSHVVTLLNFILFLKKKFSQIIYLLRFLAFRVSILWSMDDSLTQFGYC